MERGNVGGREEGEGTRGKNRWLKEERDKAEASLRRFVEEMDSAVKEWEKDNERMGEEYDRMVEECERMVEYQRMTEQGRRHLGPDHKVLFVL